MKWSAYFTGRGAAAALADANQFLVMQSGVPLRATGSQLKSYLQYLNTYVDTVPTTAIDPGTAGQYAADASYLYICVATDTWARVALSSW